MLLRVRELFGDFQPADAHGGRARASGWRVEVYWGKPCLSGEVEEMGVLWFSDPDVVVTDVSVSCCDSFSV